MSVPSQIHPESNPPWSLQVLFRVFKSTMHYPLSQGRLVGKGGKRHMILFKLGPGKKLQTEH